MPLAKNQAACLSFGRVGWKYYNSIRKKAVEQEFSWSGLFISLSIAFFIVAISACALNVFNRSLAADRAAKPQIERGLSRPAEIFFSTLA